MLQFRFIARHHALSWDDVTSILTTISPFGEQAVGWLAVPKEDILFCSVLTWSALSCLDLTMVFMSSRTLEIMVNALLWKNDLFPNLTFVQVVADPEELRTKEGIELCSSLVLLFRIRTANGHTMALRCSRGYKVHEHYPLPDEWLKKLEGLMRSKRVVDNEAAMAVLPSR
ncbi:hypothetical protein OF83DRAFT_1179985 [Amylostereum chailletii]|nr:hypothetical protein OF83DRAFT_1179985 [Amylostereum chailletii]